nr:hypothetical protein [Tanacetum cinerariifolium]
MTLVKHSQELKTVSYHKLYDILKQYQHEVNEIRAEKIARVANPLALVAQQQPVYHPQTHPTHYNQNSSTRLQQATTRNRGKAIVNSSQPIYDQEPSMVDDDDETSKDKEIDKLMDLISLSLKKIYKPTNNNLRTSSNTSRTNQDNSPRINRNVGYESQRSGNVAGARETVELEAHYMYMAKTQEVSPDAVDSGSIFDAEPEQKANTEVSSDMKERSTSNSYLVSSMKDVLSNPPILMINPIFAPPSQILRVPCQGVCVYTPDWPFPSLHKYLKNKGVDTILDPFQMIVSKLKTEFKKWEVILSKNVVSLTRNKDHPNACLYYMLYCLATEKPFNLTYYIASRIHFKDKGKRPRLPTPTPPDSESSDTPSPTPHQNVENDPMNNYTLDLIPYINQLPPIEGGESLEFKKNKGMFKFLFNYLCKKK